jgi:hypothetical protein
MTTESEDLKVINYHGFGMLQSSASYVGPYFCNAIAHRIHSKRATNIVFTGEPGIGKSYMALETARVIEGRTADGKDRFTMEQVVFTFSEFMDLVLRLKSGKIIVFDEPSFAMGKREWYKELNQALVKTVESFRFKLHPLFIPIVNKTLLDKTIRDYLIQYQVNVHGRGRATVYRLNPSQFKDKMYHEHFCDLSYRMADLDECSKDSCLGCPDIMTCMVFRAQYERKKAEIQDSRYEQSKEQAERSESRHMGISELEALALDLKPQWLIDNKINVQRLRTALREAHSIQISLNRAYQLKATLTAHGIGV